MKKKCKNVINRMESSEEIEMLRAEIKELKEKLSRYTNNECHKRYKENNKEKILERAREYNRRYREKNKEKVLEYAREYAKKKREKECVKNENKKCIESFITH